MSRNPELSKIDAAITSKSLEMIFLSKNKYPILTLELINCGSNKAADLLYSKVYSAGHLKKLFYLFNV